jgi:hypothetical protein
MKVDEMLLTKQDIINSKIKNNIDGYVLERLNKEKTDLITNECDERRVNYYELIDSEDKIYLLKREYNKHDKNFECLFFGLLSIFGIGSTIFSNIYCGFVIQNLWILIAWGIVSVALIYLGIKGLIIRHKIKKNYKELDLEI